MQAYKIEFEAYPYSRTQTQETGDIDSYYLSEQELLRLFKKDYLSKNPKDFFKGYPDWANLFGKNKVVNLIGQTTREGRMWGFHYIVRFLANDMKEAEKVANRVMGDLQEYGAYNTADVETENPYYDEDDFDDEYINEEIGMDFWWNGDVWADPFFNEKSLKGMTIKEEIKVPGTDIVLEKGDKVLYKEAGRIVYRGGVPCRIIKDYSKKKRKLSGRLWRPEAIFKGSYEV